MCASVVTHPHTRGANALAAREVTIGPLGLAGTLHLPASASALVVFAHGSGSSRFSPRNMAAANALNARGIATLLFDLLTPDEERDRSNVFDIQLLAGRLIDVVHWIDNDPELACTAAWLVRSEHGSGGGPGRRGTTRLAYWRGCLPRRPARSRGCCA